MGHILLLVLRLISDLSTFKLLVHRAVGPFLVIMRLSNQWKVLMLWQLAILKRRHHQSHLMSWKELELLLPLQSVHPQLPAQLLNLWMLNLVSGNWKKGSHHSSLMVDIVILHSWKILLLPPLLSPQKKARRRNSWTTVSWIFERV